MAELARIEDTAPRPYRKYSVAQVIEALEHGRGLIAPAARYLGCSRSTVRSYLEEYPAVAQAKLDQQEAVKDMAENALYAAILRAKPGLYAFTSSAWPKTVATSRRQSYPAQVVSPSASSLFTMNSGHPPRWRTDLLGGGGGSLKSRASGKGAGAPQMFLHKIHLFT